MKKLLIIVVLVLLSVPSFLRMLRPGIFSTQDFHFIRFLEYNKCITDLQLPCRWTPDIGAGFGEPLFNFYGQFVYFLGELFHLIGFSLIDSLKILFILSFALSSVSMFFLAKKIWQNNFSAIISSLTYLYAPYRAVDVWVRGALPESFSFVIFPLCILFFENYLEKEKKKHLLLFSLSLSTLVLTHNLSVILFFPFLIIWIIYRLSLFKKPKILINLALASIFSFLISAFYILPVIFESKFIKLQSTTLGFFDWKAHFVTLNQLFISRFWGYGASVWGADDGLSLSVGQIQWLVPLVICILFLVKLAKTKKISKSDLDFLIILSVGMFALFLTHNKSTFIWNNLHFMPYIQFPWRFLSLAVFCFALASGSIFQYLENFKIPIYLIILLSCFILNFPFFKEDIWYQVIDADLQMGQKWTESKFASLSDYWPNYGPLPSHEAPTETEDIKLITQKSNVQIFELKNVDKNIEFPIAYFPGWEAKIGSEKIKIYPSQNGLISASIKNPESKAIAFVFKNTQFRNIGNLISLASIIGWFVLFLL